MNERDIFDAALAITDSDERAAYLDGVCGDDVTQRSRLQELLDAQQRLGSFLDAPLPGVGATIDQTVTEKPGTVIGPYKLLQQIGEGGMGVVYMAEQKEPVKRRVALKIIKPGMDTRQVIARFEAERQALAMMDHPNIAKVLDAGATDSGRPYFVMELVNGISVTQYCDEQHLTPKERLELFVPICQAVQHAHQKGIIHRDLKPSNVMVAVYDDLAVPKVIDFGVAKATSQTLTEKTMFTQLGQIVGTLEYMSPEQAKRNQLDVDTRSDIYSLGVLLYELLTGDTPFDRQRLRSAAFDEMLRIIREEEPLKPSTKVSSSEALASIAANRRIDAQRLGSTIRGELDWIVMKALEKDRVRRYETASKFAEDVQHYLNDEAVVACPPSASYRFKIFARRNKAVITTTSAIATALILGIIGSTWLSIQATREKARAVQAEANVRLEQGELKKALSRETSLRKSEQEQRQRAEENFAMARGAVDQFLKTIAEEDLMNIPGLQPIQRQLLSSALPFLESYVADHGEDPQLRLELAEVYRQLGRLHSKLEDKDLARVSYQKALAMFEQLRKEDDNNNRVLSGIAWLNHMVLGRYDDAIAIYRDLLTRTPDDEQILLELAQTLCTKSSRTGPQDEDARRRRLLEAESLVREVLEHNPDSERAPGKLTFILSNLGALEGNSEKGLNYWEGAADQGLAALRRTPYATRLGGAAATACNNVAVLLANQGDEEQALAWRERQVEVARISAYANPLVLETWTPLYRSYREIARQQEISGRTDEARRSFWRAAEVIEHLPRLTFRDRVYLGDLYYSLAMLADKDHQTASDGDRAHYFTKAVATLREAFTLVENGELDDVIPNSGKAARIHPILSNLAWRLATADDPKLRDTIHAVEFATKAIELSPGSSYKWQVLGWTYYRNGEWRKTIEAMEKAVALQRNVGDPDQWFFLAMAHWQLGNHEQARQWYAKSIADMGTSFKKRRLQFRAEVEELMGIRRQESGDGESRDKSQENGKNQK